MECVYGMTQTSIKCTCSLKKKIFFYYFSFFLSNEERKKEK